MLRLCLVWMLCAGISLHCVLANTPLINQLRAAKHDSTRLRLYTALALDYRDKNNFDSLLIYSQVGLRLAKNLNNTYYCSDLYRCQAIYYRFKKQYEPAIKMALMAIDLGKKNKQYIKVELAGYLLAVIYCDKAFSTGDPQTQIKAIRQLFDNIRFSNQHQTFLQIDNNYSLLSAIYKDNGNDSLAYLYLEKRIQYFKDLKQPRGQLSNLLAKFSLFLYKKQTEEAKKYLVNILNFDVEEKNYHYYFYILSEATKTCIKFQQFDLAYSIIQKAESKMRIMDDERQMIFNIEKATIFLHLKKYTLAQQANQQAIFLSKKIKLAFGDQLSILINQQKLFEHQKRFAESLALNKRIHAMQDSLSSAQYSFELAASEERLAFENKERLYKQQLKISQLENQNKAQALQNTKQWQSVLAIAIFLLLGVVGIIALQMRKITRQSVVLRQLNETKNQILAVIGHDLRTPILTMYSTLKRMAHTKSATKQTKWPAEQLPRLNSLLMTTDNLLYWSQIQQYNQKVASLSLVLAEVIADVLELLEATIEEAAITVQNQVPDTTVVKADQDHLQIILRNIIQNAIKFTPPNGTITLRTHATATHVALEVQDSGIGFLKSQATGYKKGTHLGLKLVKELMEANQGSLTIENPNEGGALVRLMFLKG